MTTIITIVVVALVFFVTVCIVGFMVWKREAEMRTDSIKAIEYNLEEVLHELTGSSSRELRRRAKIEEIAEDRNEYPSDHARNRDEPQHETNYRAEREAHREDDLRDYVQGGPQNTAEPVREETNDERITVFEPVAVQYTSFDRGSGLVEKDGRHGLRWKEIQQPQEDAEAHGTPEVSQVLEPIQGSGDHASVEEVELPDVSASNPDPEITESADETMSLPGSQFDPQLEPEEEEILRPEPYDQPEPVAAESEEEDEREEESGPLLKFLKRHKKSKDEPEPEISEEEGTPEQEIYESIDDLLRDYISEPHDERETTGEAWDGPEQETYYREPIKPGYDIGKSGRKYTAEELEVLIKE